MAYFRDDEARTIIRESYGQVRSAETTVARAFYAPEEIDATIEENVAQEYRLQRDGQ